MKTVSISVLKANLSRYLRDVRRGSEVQVLDRGVPVARLVPPGASAVSDAATRERLIQNGVLRPGKGRMDSILKTPPLRLPGGLSAALDAEREDRF